MKWVDQFRRDRGKDLPDWPGCYTIFCDDAGGTQTVPPDRVPDIGWLGGFFKETLMVGCLI
ncbi:uncharacterized protein Dvar_32080 [Desulfosarcina variabilis str. Montpellier]|uniref:hypothetical protein n=1 Tax=Desulfosarcina variabilis TaxID=2300 RepID=UPI003AFB1AE8